MSSLNEIVSLSVQASEKKLNKFVKGETDVELALMRFLVKRKFPRAKQFLNPIDQVHKCIINFLN